MDINIGDVSAEAFGIIWRAVYCEDLSFVKTIGELKLLRDALAASHRFEMQRLQNELELRLVKVLEDAL